jgi:hypothetical protein
MAVVPSRATLLGHQALLQRKLIIGDGGVLEHSSWHLPLGTAPELERALAMHNVLAVGPAAYENRQHPKSPRHATIGNNN